MVWKHQFFSVLNLLDGLALRFVHDYLKTMAFTIWTFVSKVMALLFNMPSRFVIAFFPRTKRLLISRLQSHVRGHFNQKEQILNGIV